MAEENKVLANTAKCIRGETKRGADMNLKLVESLLEQDFNADRRHKKGKKKHWKTRKGSSSSESSSSDEKEDRLEEQTMIATNQMQPIQRHLSPSWKPECQKPQFCQPTWNNGVGSPMQEH